MKCVIHSFLHLSRSFTGTRAAAPSSATASLQIASSPLDTIKANLFSLFAFRYTSRGAIIGEGKPENQNHAVIFCHGEALQTIDMNQASAVTGAVLASFFLLLVQAKHCIKLLHSDLKDGGLGYQSSHSNGMRFNRNLMHAQPAGPFLLSYSLEPTALTPPQDNHICEAYKMRNLLGELTGGRRPAPALDLVLPRCASRVVLFIYSF